MCIQEFVTKEGWRGGRPVELHLARSTMPMFSFSWTVTHYITEDSPLAAYVAHLGPDVVPLPAGATGHTIHPHKHDHHKHTRRLSAAGVAAEAAPPTAAAAAAVAPEEPKAPADTSDLPPLSALELLVLFQGEDATQHQTLRASTAYAGEDGFAVNCRYVDMMTHPKYGVTESPSSRRRCAPEWLCGSRSPGVIVDLRRIDDLVPLNETEGGAVTATA